MLLLSAWHVYKRSNISEAAKFACGIFQAGVCHIQLILYLQLLMSIFSNTRNKERTKGKECRVPTCKIQVATGDIQCVSNYSSRNNPSRAFHFLGESTESREPACQQSYQSPNNSNSSNSKNQRLKQNGVYAICFKEPSVSQLTVHSSNRN